MQLSFSKFYKFILSLYLLEEMILANLAWSSPYNNILRSLSAIGYYFVIGVIILYAITYFCIKKSLFPVLALIVLLIAYISGKITNDSTLTLIFPIIFLSFNQSLSEILKFYFKNLLFFFILILILFKLGLTENLIVNFNYGIGYSLGTGHPNNLAAYIVNITLLFLYLYLRDKSVWINIGTGVIVSIIIWKLTVSRTAVTEIILYVILFLLYRLLKIIRNKWIFRLIEIIGVMIVLASIYFMLNYSQLSASDSSLIVRFSQGNKIYSMYGIHLWGTAIPFVSTFEAAQLHIPALILDNGYLRMLIYHGIACSIIFFIIILCMFKNLNKNNKYCLLLIAIVFMVGGFMEKSVYLPQYNFTLIVTFMQMNLKLLNSKKKYEV